MTNKEPSSLLAAIAQISHFSYEPSIKKHPFLKKYLEKEKDPKGCWTIYMTAAGAGYALSRKEEYPGEHDELIQSVENLKDNGIMAKLVIEFATFMQDTYRKNKKLYNICIGMWVLAKIKKGKPNKKDLEDFVPDVNKLFELTISEYEEKRLKQNK